MRLVLQTSSVAADMRKMKDSGIAWVGECPGHWEQHPVYYYFSERKAPNVLLAETNLLSLSYGKIKRKDINTNGGLLPASFNTYNIIEDGDIIIRPTDLQNDKRSLRTALSTEHGIITSAYIALRPKLGVNSAYFHYLLHAYDVQKVFYNMGNGVRQGLNYSEFSILMLLVPPKDEQLAIVSFLDSKCAEIDALVEDIQAEISTLEELKNSIITEAVTKGLNPNVEMKNSGIEWLGLMPAKWRVVRLGYICQKLNRTTSKSAPILICSNSGKVIYRSEKHTGLTSEKEEMFQGVASGDLLIHGMDTWHGAIAVSSYSGRCTTVVHVCESSENKSFLAYYLQMLAIKKVYKAISNGIRGNTSDFRSWEKTKVIKVALPNTRKEQDEIAEYLDKKRKAIDETLSSKQKQLRVLEEYKKSLIYEYVTGKKEVPHK